VPPFQKLSFLALVAGIVACLFLPGGIGLPDRGLAPNGSDSPKIVPLDLKSGLWELSVHTSTTDLDYAGNEAAVELNWKSLTPEQRAKAIADLKAAELKTVEQQKKARTRKAALVL
jgi:hypothetical protein